MEPPDTKSTSVISKINNTSIKLFGLNKDKEIDSILSGWIV